MDGAGASDCRGGEGCCSVGPAGVVRLGKPSGWGGGGNFSARRRIVIFSTIMMLPSSSRGLYIK